LPAGRPPKPTKLRKLEGNPGKRPLNEKEPEPVGVARKPDFVTGAAAEEWDRALAAMPPRFYTFADVPVLTVYCLAWVQYRNALALVAREGMTSIGSTGQKTAHPALAVAAKQAEIILRASDRLGMSPVARTRLEIQDQTPASKFDGLIGADRGLRLVK
jgi:P27 family predicted phage terminase small subunit